MGAMQKLKAYLLQLRKENKRGGKCGKYSVAKVLDPLPPPRYPNGFQ